ncbi:MAG: rod shape-determining protein MreC [Acidiferrobacter sp.]
MGTFLGWSIRRPTNFTKFVVLAVVSVVLIAADAHHKHETHTVRALVDRVVHPLQTLASLPQAIMGDIGRDLNTNSELRTENRRLSRQDILLRARLTRFNALSAEVARLRQLLKAPPPRGYRQTLAPVLAVSSGPFTRRLVLAEGVNAHVFVGQAVIDAHGIVGQVIKVGPETSEVMLITDPNSGVPVVSQRNGLRAIVFGTGSPRDLKIPYLTITADIRPGDVLLSSGLGGIYPAGYPVARVTRVVSNPNEAFLKVVAEPLARLNYHTTVLLLWPQPTATRALSPRPSKGRTGRGHHGPS